MNDTTPFLARRIVEYLGKSDYRPMKQHELARALKLSNASDRRTLRDALKALERKGLIMRLRKNRWSLPAPDEPTLAGTLSVTPEGFGFVTLADAESADVYIPRRAMGTALHGDRVEIALTAARPRREARGRRPDARKRRNTTPDESPRGPAGRVVRVLTRRFTELPGILKATRQYRYVIPDHPRIQVNIAVVDHDPQIEHDIPDGHRVLVALRPWTHAEQSLTGTILEDLGPADHPESQMRGLVRQHGLRESFPDPIQQAAQRIQPRTLIPRETTRHDLRDELLFTIDPPDARDFDDAVSLRQTPENEWELGVHIADVTAYVEPNSTIDREAATRGNSVYLVDRVISMLPRHLTEDVCSLNPQQERLAHTVRLRITARGRVTAVETYPSVIRSAARLDYDQVQQLFNGEPHHGIAEEIVPVLQHMRKLAHVLRRKRARAGAILFEMPEVRCILDDRGEPVALEPRTALEAYHLIEEFMLAANRSVAERIQTAGYPVPYRIHAPPDEEGWARITEDLDTLGIEVSEATRRVLTAIADQYANTPMARIVNLSILRNLKRAVYSADCAAHFGLAFDRYLHFTSPIRRYPDLIAHRVLNAVEQHKPPPYSPADIERMAEQSSRTEREAAEAELESIDLKRIAYYARALERGEIGPYRALVTGTTGRGLLVELWDTLQRGMIPHALLREEPPHSRRRSRGRTPRPARIGDLVQVELVRVDEARKRVEMRIP